MYVRPTSKKQRRSKLRKMGAVKFWDVWKFGKSGGGEVIIKMSLSAWFVWVVDFIHWPGRGGSVVVIALWRHRMETFSALLALCAGNSPVTGKIPLTKASDAELWCFLWSAPEQTVEQTIEPLMVGWLETPSRSLWRHCNGKGAIF